MKTLAVAFALALVGPASGRQAKPQDRPAPDVKDEKYGPHERNVIDLWKAK